MPPIQTRASSTTDGSTAASVGLSTPVDLPPATLARLPVYLRELNLLSQGKTIEPESPPRRRSSVDSAAAAAATAAAVESDQQ